MTFQKQPPFVWRKPPQGDRISYVKYAIVALIFFLTCYYSAYSIAQLHNYRIIIPEHGGQYLTFHPAWTLVYISIYIAQSLTLLAVRSKEECLAWSQSLCYSVGMATVIFILFPTEQPPVEHLKQLSGQWMDLYRVTAIATTKANAFPSLQVASMLCTVWYSTQEKPGWFSLLMYAWFLAVAYSTVVLREHYLVDVLGGVIVAWLAIRYSQRQLRVKSIAHYGALKNPGHSQGSECG